MAFRTVQLTLVTETATPCLVKGGPAGNNTLFRNTVGTLQDPLPVIIKNEDAELVVYWGGPDVDDTHGQTIAPNASIPMNLYGESEIPYVWCDGTPVVSVAAGRQ